MHSPHTFVGKVAILLLGSLLSWVTVTVPEVNTIVATLLGQVEVEPRRETMPELPLQASSRQATLGESASVEPGPAVSVADGHHQEAMVPTQASTARAAWQADLPRDTAVQSGLVQQIAEQLRHLGASYLLLERLPHAQGDRFRARCDVAGDALPIQCCFEATRESAVEAMTEVLEAVLRMEASRVGNLDSGNLDSGNLGSST